MLFFNVAFPDVAHAVAVLAREIIASGVNPVLAVFHSQNTPPITTSEVSHMRIPAKYNINIITTPCF